MIRIRAVAARATIIADDLTKPDDWENPLMLLQPVMDSDGSVAPPSEYRFDGMNCREAKQITDMQDAPDARGRIRTARVVEVLVEDNSDYQAPEFIGSTVGVGIIDLGICGLARVEAEMFRIVSVEAA